ncbi:hypothetical protein [Streptomyces cylindrosporus]|uniref:Uncharacterized protein n=1 Tax=Streptomyces cylindrosporus TaxID=2927583 RepID=A0ABS9YLT6_9ACTN|nr:hypothetical protein [Streptomyces cylindrosporus]MCI3277510.1 hypothetical protein [Streptomyces cylindrosporus]
MVDPISAAASSAAKTVTSALTKQLQSKAGVRLGSRNERRQVYARFQAAVTQAHAGAARWYLEMRLYAVFLGKRRRPLVLSPKGARRATSEALGQMSLNHTETLQAYLDLRLVANPRPLEAADVVLERLTAVFDLTVAATDDQVNEAIFRVIEAQREFTDVCRDDLWYLPTRWQVYRVAWWKARRWRRRPAAAASSD